jgi:TolA-binding protein
MGAEQRSDETLAANYYRSGMAFFEKGQVEESLKDFQRIVDGFPDSDVADDALLQIATIRFEVQGDVKYAQTVAEQLKTKYPNHNTTPRAFILSGRLALAAGEGGVDAALADFERVTTLFPDDREAVAEAAFRGGQTAMRTGNCASATDWFRRAGVAAPKSTWTARARLGLGKCLVATGHPQDALREWQGVIRDYNGTPYATEATDHNAVAARLFLPGPSGFALARQFTVAGDTWDLHAGGTGRVYVGHEDFVSRAAEGQPLAAVARGLRDGRSVLTVGEALIVGEKRDFWMDSRRVPLTLQGRSLEDITDVAPTSDGSLVVADRGARVVARFSRAGRLLGVLTKPSGDARLATNEIDQVAVLDLGSRTVRVSSLAGGPPWEIPRLQRPVDLTFGPLSHLYVLDRERAAVTIFSNGSAKPLGEFVAKGRDGRALQDPRFLTVDALGRIHVYDRSSKQVLTFQ